MLVLAMEFSRDALSRCRARKLRPVSQRTPHSASAGGVMKDSIAEGVHSLKTEQKRSDTSTTRPGG